MTHHSSVDGKLSGLRPSDAPNVKLYLSTPKRTFQFNPRTRKPATPNI
jgi:hypothetical protein